VEFSPEDGYRSEVDFLCRVLDYHEHAIASGADARAVAYVELRVGEQTLFGVGLHRNIVTASLNAVVSGLQRAQPQHVIGQSTEVHA
jgi:2-isopropylmalate synthase